MKSYISDLPKIEEFIALDGKTLLEIGCGDGRLTALLAGKAAAVTAIDPDEAGIESAGRNVNGVNFLIGSGEKLDFAAETFDIVLFGYSLHHQDCVKALAEAGRVARPNGQILIIEPRPEGEYSRLVSIFEKDEIALLRKTFDYITSGSFNILRRDAYSVDYPFADEKALQAYFMKKYLTEKDDSAEEKMQAVIGSKKADSPLIIQDMVNIFLLTPRPPEMDSGSAAKYGRHGLQRVPIGVVGT